jgi:hypothetical protein
LATEPVLKTVEVLKPLGVRLPLPPLFTITLWMNNFTKNYVNEFNTAYKFPSSMDIMSMHLD